MPAQHAQALQQLYDGRKNALDAIIADMLIAEAAKAKGMNAEQFTEAEVTRRVKPVTEGQVVSFFQQNQATDAGPRARRDEPGDPPLSRGAGTGHSYRALVGELRKAGPRVDMIIDAPRYNVAIAPDDPGLGSAKRAGHGRSSSPTSSARSASASCRR